MVYVCVCLPLGFISLNTDIISKKYATCIHAIGILCPQCPVESECLNVIACFPLTHIPSFEVLNTACCVIDKNINHNLCEEQTLLLAYTETKLFHCNEVAVVARY